MGRLTKMAFGSQYRGRPIGQFGDAEVFSLSPTKLLVAGEGGLVTTNDATLAKAIRAMRNYGDTGSYDPEWLGMNARMSEFNAALALTGLADIDERVRRRNQIARMYTDQLASLPGLRFQSVHPNDVNTYKDYSIHVTPSQFGMTRDELAEGLLTENIETKKYFYPPMHIQKLYKSPFTTPHATISKPQKKSPAEFSVCQSMNRFRTQRSKPSRARFTGRPTQPPHARKYHSRGGSKC
jgi:dTDP-4-amino-4,6-dideoxygalactose transaminase